MKIKHEIEIDPKAISKEMKRLKRDNERLSKQLDDYRQEIYRLREIIDKYSPAIDFVDWLTSRTQKHEEE